MALRSAFTEAHVPQSAVGTRGARSIQGSTSAAARGLETMAVTFFSRRGLLPTLRVVKVPLQRESSTSWE